MNQAWTYLFWRFLGGILFASIWEKFSLKTNLGIWVKPRKKDEFGPLSSKKFQRFSLFSRKNKDSDIFLHKLFVGTVSWRIFGIWFDFTEKVRSDCNLSIWQIHGLTEKWTQFSIFFSFTRKFRFGALSLVYSASLWKLNGFSRNFCISSITEFWLIQCSELWWNFCRFNIFHEKTCNYFFWGIFTEKRQKNSICSSLVSRNVLFVFVLAQL